MLRPYFAQNERFWRLYECMGITSAILVFYYFVVTMLILRARTTLPPPLGVAFRQLNLRGIFRGCSVPFRGLNTTLVSFSSFTITVLLKFNCAYRTCSLCLQPSTVCSQALKCVRRHGLSSFEVHPRKCFSWSLQIFFRSHIEGKAL